MATTTNYSWTTPDDTALVKDGASAIRTLGSSIDTTTKALNPSTTLGDIEYRSSTANTNTRLGIGSTGNVLTVAGGVPTWAAPAGGGGSSFTLLNSGGTALSGSNSTTISGISAKNTVYLFFTNASSVNANSTIQVQLNSDTGANYNYIGNRFTSSSAYTTDIFNGIDNTGQSDFALGMIGNNSLCRLTGFMKIEGANTTNPKIIQFHTGQKSVSGGVDGYGQSCGGWYDGSSAISSITIKSSSGNFDLGTVYVYTSAV